MRHPYKKHPKRGPDLENYPYACCTFALSMVAVIVVGRIAKVSIASVVAIMTGIMVVFLHEAIPNP